MSEINLLSNFNRQDIFGYYTVGKLKMYSQIEAVEISQRLNLPIDWHFNEEVFRHCDWIVEPKESISDLYRKRCEQLREKYDHLILVYSGGADSDNILNFFIENNIRLDEVVSYTNYEGSQNRLSQFNAEIFEVAIPKIKKVQEKQPLLKHTIIDTTQLTLKKFSSLNLDLIYNQNTTTGTFSTIKDEMKMTQKHWREMFSIGKKVGFIWGVDKPRVLLDDDLNCNYIFTSAGISAAITPAMQRRNSTWEFDELFYWSPDFPKIPIKQAHIIKNFIKRVGINQFKTKPRKVKETILQPPKSSFVLTHGNNYLQNHDLVRLIYPYWYDIPHQYKAINLIIYEKEMWFNGKINSEEQAKNWKIITQKMLEITKTDYRKQSWLNHSLHVSKPYNLGK